VTAEAARAALRSDAYTVLVEAPAGTGKTYEAVDVALDLANALPDRREILLLAHTNAAVDEFRSRSRAAKAPVRATTFDALATELLAPYARTLGLGYPLRPQPEGSKIPGGTPFPLLVPTLVKLFQRSPALAAALAGHYPWVICDEHQDASEAQQELVDLLASHGARVRYFGDPMQAIYDFDGQVLVDWTSLAGRTQLVEELALPKRWKDAPELGRWLLDARIALRDGRRIPAAPACVMIERVAGFSDKSLANPNRTAPVMEIKEALNSAVRGKGGSVGVLTYTGAHRRGLQALLWRFEMFEGTDMHQAHEAVYAAAQADGDARALILVAVDLLALCCSGFNREVLGQIGRACTSTGVRTAKIAKGAAPIVDRLRPLYEKPTLTTWCQVVGGFIYAPADVRPVMLSTLRAIGRLGRTSATYEQFAEQTGGSRRRTELPTRGVYTIHAAKGREFDHVVLAHCGARLFPDEPATRKLLYVALSRARLTVHVLAPSDAPSPLLP